ncbi:MAG: hypothetical protein JXQ75_15275 [Phycisphaerae bacterium]|nr:hypothetical protein [Phycisphaerae bacterium]
MAVDSGGKGVEATSGGHRFAIGANVAISIIVAALLVVAVNWICSIKYVREDLASFSNYGLSDRSKSILDGYPDDIQMWVLYAPDEEDEKQQGYIERLQDYCDELERYASHVKVTYVTSDSQREKLAAQISSTFGGEAQKHQEALSSFAALRKDLDSEVQRRLLECGALMDRESWLGDFPLFASVVATFQADQRTLKKAAEEIEELAPEGGIPKYADATSKAKAALTEVKGHFEAIALRMGELAELAEETSKPDSIYVAMLRQVAAEANEAVSSLRQVVGEQDAPVPADPSEALRGLKEQGEQVGKKLNALVRRVDDFAQKFPMVRQHPNWTTQVRVGPLRLQMAVADVLQRAEETLAQARLGILSVLDRGDPEQLKQALVGAREDVAIMEQNASVCEELLKGLADRLSSLDDGSRAMLDAARGGQLMSEKVAAIDTLVKEIEGLPELKLGSVADQLKQDNVVVIEANGKIRVVGFSEVFPMQESVGGPGAASEELGRTFNGDSAIPSAILALTRGHPFATVVLVAFEPPAPQQRGPFSPPPPRSWIPSRSLSQLRERLEAANFKVVDWNLATPEAAAPEPEEGTENVYVLLPPAAPAQPNPFDRQQPPGPEFGEEQRQKMRDLLAEDARMIFLATWEVGGGGPFGGPARTPPYGYGPLLANDWGIVVDNSRRVVWIEPDRQKANTFMVAHRLFNHMPAGGFLDHPVGKPMQGSRFLINDACTIKVKDKLPEGVTVETVLRIPDKENYIGASLSEIIQIIDQLQNRRTEGKVTLDPPPEHGPFDVMVTAERREGEESKGKIAVIGFGASVRGDYLENPVVAPGDVLRLDPPPTENADLFVNTLYWLQGQTQWIARGAVPVPRVEPIAATSLMALRVFIWGVWPAAVFAAGVVMWWVRRR